jgi:hypothetical protein
LRSVPFAACSGRHLTFWPRAAILRSLADFPSSIAFWRTPGRLACTSRQNRSQKVAVTLADSRGRTPRDLTLLEPQKDAWYPVGRQVELGTSPADSSIEHSTVMKLPIVRATLLVLIFTTWVTASHAAEAQGDAEARKLMAAAMESDFSNDKFDAADNKLTQAVAICRRKGCSRPVLASIYGYFAVISWVADQDNEGTIRDLKSMLQINPQQKLDEEYAPVEMDRLLKKAQQQLGSASETQDPEERRSSAADDKKEAARTAAEERKEAQRQAAEDGRRAAEDKREAARIAAEEKREAQRQKVEDARRAAEDKKEAARVAAEERREAARIAAEEARAAAEEKKEAARIAAEEARAAAEEKKEAARKAAEEKRDAARKALEEKKEAARKAAEEKKEAKLKAAEEARQAAAEKKEAARKAAEEKKAEAARKAEEARLAEIDKRMRTPPPPGKLVEEPWKGQALGYPILVRVKLPPPPPKIEPERVAVVKVVTEYSGPGVPVPAKVELKPTKEGAYEGSLPCDVSKQEGEVSYYTTAYNKYDNVVAASGSSKTPNQVQIKAEFASRLAHMPGELPPISCEESERKAKAAAPKEPAASAGPVCEGADCGKGAQPLPVVKPAGRGCLRCVLGKAQPSTDWEAITSLGVAALYFVRRKSRRAA